MISERVEEDVQRIGDRFIRIVMKGGVLTRGRGKGDMMFEPQSR
jgi:hypothetical protein